MTETVIPIKPAPTKADISAALEKGLKNLWYPICPSDWITDKPRALRRLGYKLAL